MSKAPGFVSARTSGFTLLSGAISIFVAALILYPLGRVLLVTFFPDGQFDTAPFRVVAQSGLPKLLGNTVVAIGSATVFAVVAGTFFAWLVERTDVGLRSLGRLLPILPLLVPPIAGAVGWLLLGAPRSGFLNAWTRYLFEMLGFSEIGAVVNIFSMAGLVYVYVIYLVPHVFLSVSAGLRNLDPALEEAARISGAGPVKTILTVTVPAILPQVISGGILAMIYGFTLFSVPLVVGGQADIEVLAVRIVHLMTASFPPHTGEALLLGLLIVAVIGASWWVQRLVLRRGAFATIGGKGQSVATVRLGLLRWPARVLLALYVLIATVLPVSALILVSLQPFWSPKVVFERLDFDNYVNLLGSDFVRGGVINSLILGITGATVGMLIAAVIVFWVQRNSHRPIATLIDATTKLPAAVSNLVIAIAFIVAFAGAPFYLHGTFAILFLAYIVLYTPQSTLTANAALVQVGSQLSEASLISGAGTGRTFWNVTLPLMTPGLLAGWTMLFVLIAGDITASSMLAGSRNPVAGFVILDIWTGGSFPPLAAFAVIVTLSMSFVVIVSLVLTRRLG
jgi:iron(III) transport system permease protein